MKLNALNLNEQKAIEVILYMASKLTSLNFHQSFKLLYFSDKLHLGKYGRLILDDGYVAMKHGPVPSQLYDLLKLCRNQHTDIPFNDSILVDNYIIKPLRQPNLELLSESECECLDESIKRYGKLSFNELTELSHDDAWKKADNNDYISIEDIAATLPNSSELLEHLKNPYGD